MTSATMKRAALEREGYGLALFASVMLLILGCFNLIYGIAAVANAHVFIANAHYLFGTLNSWGWVTLCIGALQLLGAAGVMAGNQLERSLIDDVRWADVRCVRSHVTWPSPGRFGQAGGQVSRELQEPVRSG
jgi:hypothetical protein